MKKFNSIREFINYSPDCLFCNERLTTVISSHSNKLSKNTSMSLLMQKVVGNPLYRGIIEKSPLNVKYLYSARIENDTMILSCTEKFYSSQQPQQSYDVLSINLDSSEVQLQPQVEVGVLNSFARINFNFVCMCKNKNCSGHLYVSTGIIAGGKSKKLMPFFLKEECMMGGSGDDIIYTLRSSYYSQLSSLEKTNETHDYNNPFTGLITTESATPLPLIDMSTITTKAIFENKVENYVTFS